MVCLFCVLSLMCLETTGCAAECWFMWRYREDLAPEDECCFIVLHCAELIIPVTSVTSPPQIWTEVSTVLSDSRLPSDVTFEWLETPRWKAAAACTAALRNYLLLRNQCDLMHESRLCQGFRTQESFYSLVWSRI